MASTTTDVRTTVVTGATCVGTYAVAAGRLRTGLISGPVSGSISGSVSGPVSGFVGLGAGDDDTRRGAGDVRLVPSTRVTARHRAVRPLRPSGTPVPVSVSPPTAP